MPTFFFVTIFQQELGSAGKTITSAVTPVAFGILATMLLLNIYEVAIRGGRPKDLVVSLLKYAACALIIQYWFTFFGNVSSGVATLAVNISSTDFVSTWSSIWQTAGGPLPNWTFNLFSLGIVPLLSAVMWVITAICYYLIMTIFGIMYTAWGLILCGLGPILIALMPSNATNSFAKHYLKSLAEWAAWPFLYAIIGVLAGSMATLTNNSASTAIQASAILGPVWNLLQNIIIAAIYICFLIVIPFISSHLINGNFGSTVMSTVKSLAAVASAGTTAVAAGAAVGAGAKAGAASVSAGKSASHTASAVKSAASSAWKSVHGKGGGTPPAASPAKRLMGAMAKGNRAPSSREK
jgi:hypothetical protein